MNKPEKRQFIENVCNTMKASIMQKLDAMPEKWDGAELRAYIAEAAKKCTDADRYLTGKRKKDFKNDLLINPL